MMNGDSILEFWPRIYRFLFVFHFDSINYVKACSKGKKIKNREPLSVVFYDKFLGIYLSL